MKYRRLGQTDLDVSVIGLGALFLDRVGVDDAQRVVERAVERGVNLVQCAHEWGRNEELLARALSDGLRNRILLCGASEGQIDGARYMELMEQGLRRYRTEHYDLYMLANISNEARLSAVMAPGGGLEVLKRAKKQGKIRCLGVASHGSSKFVRQLVDCGEFEFVMVSYNVAEVHRESGHALDEDIGHVGQDVIPYAAERNVGVLAMKALGGGLLSPSISDPALRAVVSTPVSTPASLALRYVVAREDISSAVVGMNRLHEVEENCAVGDAPHALTTEEHRTLSDAVSGIRQTYCRGCHHCEHACPKEIVIGRILQWEALIGWPMHEQSIRRDYGELEHKADECIECRLCEADCPYGIDVVGGLRRAHKTLLSAHTQGVNRPLPARSETG